MSVPPSTPRAATALAAALVLAACERADSPSSGAPAPPSSGERALVVGSSFQAGPYVASPMVENPYEGDATAMAEGARLYGWFNCAGCHGTRGGGGMGPPLRDPDWIYGSDAASIFQSIAQGRPNGMPAFGGKVPDDQIWKIVLHVRAMGGGPPQRQGGSGDSPTQPGTSGE